MSDACAGYQPQLWHFLFPPSSILKYSCTQYDKSILVVVSFFRTVLFLIISYLIFKQTYHSYKLIFSIALPLLLYTLLNLVILILVVKKHQKY
jgi:hypothetical protein